MYKNHIEVALELPYLNIACPNNCLIPVYTSHIRMLSDNFHVEYIVMVFQFTSKVTSRCDSNSGW